MDYITDVLYKYRTYEYDIALLCCRMAYGVYFDQRLVAAHFKRWSYSTFSMFFVQKKLKK